MWFSVIFFFICAVVAAVKALAQFVVEKKLSDIFDNFADFYRQLTSEPQLRWVSKCVTHSTLLYVLKQTGGRFHKGLKLIATSNQS